MCIICVIHCSCQQVLEKWNEGTDHTPVILAVPFFFGRVLQLFHLLPLIPISTYLTNDTILIQKNGKGMTKVEEPIVEIANLQKSYGRKHVLQGVSLKVNQEKSLGISVQTVPAKVQRLKSCSG